ncbi:MAG: hypothetical protein QY327_03020 [Fimbriimonadaceae bacterium]|nr:MAG: hypothetical protein UZ18_ATM001001176 [Armatimonadetes bacterium OLB18]MBV6489929.1 hypothetical protein [Fimbriimonadaceae bacterium]QOJ12754.1 MAG: hypothetical protein HRU74_12100 [Chthonomonadaceae bacterium]MCC6351030.1 hypothetical protein [Fimbriimonadaceae bacterium]MCL4283933.1 hypothetical protein [Fimbriimonadaceae bacterium]
MLQESLFGRGQADRSINVEANLLSERIELRRAVALRSARWLLLLVVVIGSSFVVVPSILESRAEVATEIRRNRANVAILEKQVESIEKQSEVTTPMLAGHEMQERMSSQSELVLGNLLLVLNSVPKSMAVSSLRGELVGGQLAMTLRGDCESYASLRDFVAAASHGPSVKSAVLSSTRSSALLGDNGLAFDFLKKVQVAR